MRAPAEFVPRLILLQLVVARVVDRVIKRRATARAKGANGLGKLRRVGGQVSDQFRAGIKADDYGAILRAHRRC